MALTPIHNLIYDLMDSGREVTVVIYLGHYDEDNEEDVIDAYVYEDHVICQGRGGKFPATLSEVINVADFDEAMTELYKGLSE